MYDCMNCNLSISEGREYEVKGFGKVTTLCAGCFCLMQEHRDIVRCPLKCSSDWVFHKLLVEFTNAHPEAMTRFERWVLKKYQADDVYCCRECKQRLLKEYEEANPLRVLLERD